MAVSPVLSYATKDRVPLLTVRQATNLFQWCRGFLMVWACAVFLASFFGEEMTGMFIMLFAGPVALFAVAAGLVAWGRWMGDRRRSKQIAMLIAWPVLVASVMVTNWPMRVSFAMSSPALDRVADQVVAGKAPALPTRAGAYEIRRVEVRGPSVCLWTKSPRGGHVGFVRSPVGVTPNGNPWTHRQMNEQWHYFGDD